MTARYVLTSVCVQTGTMALTASLRQRLLGKERIRLVDEDGEVYEREVDWKAGVVRGVGPYYLKRRLGANEAILLHFRGDEIEVKALPRASARTPAPRPQRKPQLQDGPAPQRHQEKPKEPQERSRDEVKAVREKRAQVGTATATTTFSSPSNEGLLFSEPKAPTKALHPPGATFPITPLDIEGLLREGRVDLEAAEEVEDRLATELSERGTFAAFLLFLSGKKLGEVFRLSDLEAEAIEEGFSPEVVRQNVEVLSKPPFLVLKRLRPGEFLLRQGVEEALDDLRAFAESLKVRLSRVRM